MTRPGRHQRYGGSWFVAASALPVGGELNRPLALAKLLGAVLARPWRSIALAGLLLCTPELEVQLSDSPAGDMLREHFGQHFRGFPLSRLCQGVLILPEHHRDYLRGRPRRSVRNNLHRAAAAGIRCEDVGSASCALEAMRQVVQHRRAPLTAVDRAALTEIWPAVFAHPEVTTHAARDQSGNALALAAVVADAEICVVVLAVACNHEARWALHDYLVQTLIAGRVKYLLAAAGGPFGALGLPPDVQYYQHLLGYALCHVCVPDTRVPPVRRVDRGKPGTPRLCSLYEQLAQRGKLPNHQVPGAEVPHI